MEASPRIVESPSAADLARHYRGFRVSDRVLLTGHSHQAWPDVAEGAMSRAWADAAELVDDKWGRAFEVADHVRGEWRRLLDDPDGSVALGQNTFELVSRFLSALPLRARPRIVTTDGEFHTIRRLLSRLAEEGLEIEWIPSDDREALAARLCSAVDDRTAAVLVSSVLFRNAWIVPGLGGVADACRRVGAELLVDTYHHLNVVPFSVRESGLEEAFVVGGGYKYCQLGEGNCFLRFPEASGLRPVLTGWFAEFGALARAPGDEGVAYAPGDGLFAGATYDPVSHYRAQAVFDFFGEQDLTPEKLRRISQRQVGRLAGSVDELDLPPALLRRDRSVPLDRLAGFLALETPHAEAISRALKERGVHTDYRGSILRFGPAPYVTDPQLDQAVEALSEVVGELAAMA